MDIPIAGQIANLYAWTLGIGALIALGVFIFGGILYTTSAGNESRMGEAKEWVFGAVIGLFILLGSYLILNTINPELTKLKDLELIVNKAADQDKPDDTVSKSDNNSGAMFQSGSGNPTAVCLSALECQVIYDEYCRGKNDCEGIVSGVLPASEATEFPIIFGVKSQPGVRISPQIREGLERAGAEAIRQGYSLYIVSGYRSLKRQLEIALEDFSRVPALVAYPGGSNHGSGRAVDIYLEGKSQGAHTATDCRILAEIMYAAGWERYVNEFWHFEYPAGSGNPTRSTNVFDCRGG